jgi:hypothetical protein
MGQAVSRKRKYSEESLSTEDFYRYGYAALCWRHDPERLAEMLAYDSENTEIKVTLPRVSREFVKAMTSQGFCATWEPAGNIFRRWTFRRYTLMELEDYSL